MANNYSTLKLDHKTEKIVLARLEPARYISDDLSLDSGTTYTMTFSFTSLSKIEVDGVASTLVTGTPSSGEHSFDQSTKLITINLGAALGSKVVVAFYYIFYTNDYDKNIYQDPEDSTKQVRPWKARIANIPNFSLAQRDVINGFLEIGSTTLSLFNPDDDFQQYLTDNDSFFNKEIKLWTCLDKLSNIKKLYDGRVTGISVGNVVSLVIDSSLSTLNGTYYSNGTWLLSTFNATTFSNVRLADRNKPIPKFFSKVTWFRTVFNFPLVQSVSAGGLGSAMTMSSAPKAINTNYNTTRSTSNNRTWSTYVANDTAGDFSDGIDAVASHGLNQYTLTLNGADNSWFRYGDNIYIESTANVGYVQRLTSTDQVRIFVNTITPTTSHTIYRPEISVVHITDPTEQKNNLPIRLELKYNRDYTFSTDGNGVRKIDLVNNFETNHSDYTGPLHQDATVEYRAWNDDDLTHGNVVDTILTDAGLTLDSTSKTNANATDIDMSFTVPFKNTLQFPKRIDILKRILGTTLGVLSLGSDFEIEYLLLDAPSTGTTTTLKRQMLGFNQRIVYRDLVSEVNYKNEHNFLDEDDVGTVTDRVNSNNDVSTKVKHLHGIERIININHVAEETTNTFTRLTSLLYERKAYYTFSTKGQHFESNLNEDITLGRDDIIGGSATRDVTIIEINKKTNQTDIVCTDLLNIT